VSPKGAPAYPAAATSGQAMRDREQNAVAGGDPTCSLICLNLSMSTPHHPWGGISFCMRAKIKRAFQPVRRTARGSAGGEIVVDKRREAAAPGRWLLVTS